MEAHKFGKFEWKMINERIVIKSIQSYNIVALFSQAPVILKQCGMDRQILRHFGITISGSYTPRAVITRWICPVIGRFKLNSYGCSKRNSGPSGGGSVLRDCNGNVRWAQADFFGSQSNNVVEAKALMQRVG